MYNDDVIATPRDAAHFWEMAEDNYAFAWDVLQGYAVESRQDAAEPGRRSAMEVIAYRNISEDYDQRDYCLEMGRSLLSPVRQLLDRREFSPEFVQQWGKLMFCHGYLASLVFDDSDDMANVRGAMNSARLRSPEKRRRWLAHVFALPQFEGIKREAADFEMARFLIALRDDPVRSKVYPKGWFEKLLTKDELSSSFQHNNFGWTDLRPLQSTPTDDLPPLP